MSTSTYQPEYGRPGWLPFGKPFGIILMILGFIAWWPIGLAILFFMIWSKKMGCYGYRGQDGRWDNKLERLQAKMDRVRERMGGGGGPGWGQPSSSGNRAFDDYRMETMKRLEDEQREFRDFLERLRFAKDRAEFDQFMNQRRNNPGPQSPEPQQA